jgi:hypothetical protein
LNTGKIINKNNTSGLLSIKFLNFLNNIPYFKRFQAYGTSNTSLQKTSKTNNEENNKKDSSLNKNSNFFMGNLDKKGDRVLHIRDSSTGLKFTSIFDQM